ncbi:baseplate J/gp47 family protein [Geobacillus thermoleovorans]|uniref:Baseplate J protein n=1 Tax=Geobacillus thermoleovorans TaxID=33941 RepID=A0A2Z3N7W3_GEOTH|nr:baseplate J/gp47 family protein [Geobacillus thermoleovorans]AWO74980.1 baseplate J protein [Geobacillus thermoleovorans]MBW7642546.1 baseplate J/gp47 family protein [Geobacillus thermoleovorans]
MFEDQTFEAILQRMLDRVPDDVDKQEGSVIYDALAPAAMELAQMYAELDVVLRFAFGETATGEYLDRRAADFGVYRKQATSAIRKGVFTDEGGAPFDIPIGSRFRLNDMVYVAIGKIADGQFRMQAEAPGAAGNQEFGNLLPIEPIEGLGTATLADVLVPGEDEESDESLRKRFLQKVREPGTSGNAADYKRWATEVAGVGAAKVTPLWNGPGTVKITIVNTDMRPATIELVEEVQEYIEQVRPIGASVTVASATGKPINVSANVILASGYTLQNVQDAFAASLDEYLKEIAFSMTYVSYAKIGTLLLSTPGVIDYSELTVNGSTANIALQDDEVPILGMVALGV